MAIVRTAGIGLISASLAIASEPPVVAEGNVTNELLFKKRIRRRYEGQLTVEPAAAAPSAPVMEKKPALAVEKEVGVPAPRETIDFSTTRIFSPPNMRPDRPRRASKEEEDDWTLTPEERLARELKRISGEEDSTNEASDENWLTRGLADLEKEKKLAREKAKEEHRAEQEAEQIAEIMGRDLFAGLRSDPTTTPIFSGYDRTIRGPRPSMSTSAAPSATETRDRTVRTDAAVTEPPTRGAYRTSARGSDASQTDDLWISGTSLPNPKTDTVSLGSETSRAQSSVSTESPSVAPQLFKWSSSSGPGFAGLPASVAPSLSTTAKGPTAPPVLPSAAALNASPLSWSPSPTASSPSWSSERSGHLKPFSPSESPTPTSRAGPLREAVRSPFLNSTPTFAPSRFSPSESVRRP